MSRFTLSKDFRKIDPSAARVILVEAAPRILGMFDESLATKAMRFLEQLGVQIWTSSRVKNIDADGVELADEKIRAGTILWAAGVQAPHLVNAVVSNATERGVLSFRKTCPFRNIQTYSSPAISVPSLIPKQVNNCPARLRSQRSKVVLLPIQFSMISLRRPGQNSSTSTRAKWQRSGAVARLRRSAVFVSPVSLHG